MTTKLKRKSVYVAMPYRSKFGRIGRLINIYKAWRVGRELVKQGYDVFVPHVAWGFYEGLQDNDFWLECGLKELKKHQIIYLGKGWEFSEGARDELVKAQKRGLSVMGHIQLPGNITELNDDPSPITAIEDCQTVNCKLDKEANNE